MASEELAVVAVAAAEAAVVATGFAAVAVALAARVDGLELVDSCSNCWDR